MGGEWRKQFFATDVVSYSCQLKGEHTQLNDKRIWCVGATNCVTWDKAYKMAQYMSNKRERKWKRNKQARPNNTKGFETLRWRGKKNMRNIIFICIFMTLSLLALPHAAAFHFFVRKMKKTLSEIQKEEKHHLHLILFVRSLQWISLILIEFFHLRDKTFYKV